jgi:hypothetical protein
VATQMRLAISEVSSPQRILWPGERQIDRIDFQWAGFALRTAANVRARSFSTCMPPIVR